MRGTLFLCVLVFKGTKWLTRIPMALVLGNFAKGFANTVVTGLKAKAGQEFWKVIDPNDPVVHAEPDWLTFDGVPFPVHKGGRQTKRPMPYKTSARRTYRVGPGYNKYGTRSYKGRGSRKMNYNKGAHVSTRRIGGALRFGGNIGSKFMGEVKNVDFGLSPAALANSGDMSSMEVNPSVTTPVNGMIQGVSGITRIGRSIRQVSLLLKGSIVVASQINKTALDTRPEVLIAVVIDTQSNGAQANSEDYFVNPLANSILSANPMRNLSFGKRFITLKTLKFTLTMPPVAWDGTNIEQAGSHTDFSMFIPLHGRKLTYSANLNTFAAIQGGAINIFASCSSTTYVPSITYNSRLRFTDA